MSQTTSSPSTILKRPTVLTIGHSTRPLEEFLCLLQAHDVTVVLDVRKMPRSRTNPQFNIDTLPQALQAAGIGYIHLPGLGGLRRRSPNSINTGWRNPSFQAFADYMQTPEFEQALQAVMDLAQSGGRPALMCAEAVPWRCHRSLIADALVARDIRVENILTGKRAEPHALRAWARVEGTRVSYPEHSEGGDFFQAR